MQAITHPQARPAPGAKNDPDRSLDRRAENEFHSGETSLTTNKLLYRYSAESMKTLKFAKLARLCLAGIMMGCTFGLTAPAHAAPKKVLVVTVTLGFRHSSIPTARKCWPSWLPIAARSRWTMPASIPMTRSSRAGKRTNAKVDAAIKAVLARR